MTKYWIINADDFGLSPSVNRGIMESFRQETVSSATLLVNMPGFEDAVEMMSRERALGVGLHFNLTYGRPLSDPETVPTLVDDKGDFLMEIKPWAATDVQTELQQQWHRFVESGLRPTHIDTHHFIHKYESVYSLVAAFANARQVPLRLIEPAPTTCLPQPMSTDRMVIDHYFEEDGKRRLLACITAARDGVTELMCHPGYVDQYVRQISLWTDVREAELAFFTDPDISRALNHAHIQRIHFGQLQAVRSLSPMRAARAPWRRSRSAAARPGGRHA